MSKLLGDSKTTSIIGVGIAILTAIGAFAPESQAWVTPVIGILSFFGFRAAKDSTKPDGVDGSPSTFPPPPVNGQE